ncbi:hypothetical protein CHARACLAT_022598 [Characodon lateralis]|uniref:Uncharacterized protein n=1 Tax=Characodon lateralis TaxID=208331 RepID=A0ABU7EM16_9TELE|nr:hypothetical protein [Characodon lateralis]
MLLFLLQAEYAEHTSRSAWDPLTPIPTRFLCNSSFQSCRSEPGFPSLIFSLKPRTSCWSLVGNPEMNTTASSFVAPLNETENRRTSHGGI